MHKKIGLFSAAVLSVLWLTGCATTRNYQPDIDSLNSRITALQGQLSEKDQAIAKLKSQLGDQESQLSRAESEKQALSDKLNSAMSRLDEASKKPTVKTVDSDLK